MLYVGDSEFSNEALLLWVEVFLLLFIKHCRGEIQERHTQSGMEEGSEKETKGG